MGTTRKEQDTTTRIVVITLLLLAPASVATADTVVDQVGGQAIDGFTFVSLGGTYEVTVMWLNGGADLVLALVCSDGVAEPLPFGAAAAGHQRIATLKAGVPPGVVCAIAVVAARNGSKYWLSIRREADEGTTGAGRQPRMPSLRATDGEAAARVAREQAVRLRNLLR